MRRAWDVLCALAFIGIILVYELLGGDDRQWESDE